MTPSVYGSPVTLSKFQMTPTLMHLMSSGSKKNKGSPVKEPSFKVPFMESLAERCPTLRPSFIHLSKSPVYKPPLRHTRFPSGHHGFAET